MKSSFPMTCEQKMKRLAIISLIFVVFFGWSMEIFGAACCLGGGPKSFISLKRLQKYELGVSTSFQDVYGRYNVYGELEETDRNQTYSLSFGAGVRLLSDLQSYLIIPLVLQSNGNADYQNSRLSVGDVLTGVNWIVLESLFSDDWYPTISLSAGLKFPTGSKESLSAGQYLPGTGNGLWEPFVGLNLAKTLSFATVTFDASYTIPASGTPGEVEEGDKIILSESAYIPLSQRLGVGGGSSQTWALPKSQNGAILEDSASRRANIFLNSTYFLTRVMSLSAAVDFSIPIERFGVNDQASRSFTVTMKYGFY